MNKNLDLVAKELFSKLRTAFPEISLKDEESKPTDKPSAARIFDFDYVYNGENLGRITITISDKDEDDDGDVDGLVVIYSNDITNDETGYSKKQFFNFLKELREFAKQKMMNFDTRDIAKSNLEKRDYKFLSKSGDGSMTESKLYGTNRTSFQQFGESRIVVKHSAPINLNSPAGRTQRIESIYIENAEGERFKYPFKHLNGARALAQHICHGGNSYDPIGQHIIGLSEELSKLRMFKSYVERNPMVSEAMGAVNSKVMERIDQVKKEIFSLQNPGYYEQFAEGFEEPAAKEIPAEIMNDWIDRLTIKTFNEELKNVFPYIFKLVDESDIPVKDLTIEDLIDESKCSTCGMDPCGCDHKEDKEVKEFAEYEKFMNKLIEGSTDIFSDDEEAANAAIQKLNELVAQPLPVGADGTNAIESLADVIDDNELMDVFKELADIDPEQDIRDILRDYIEIKDRENGTDVLSQINFGEEAPAEEPPPAEPAAEPAPMAAAPAPAVEPPPAPAAPAPAAPVPMAEDRFARVIERAVKAGMKLEDTFEVAGKTLTLQDAIEQAGMKVEDFFGDKQQSAAGELVEYIKSMFNKEEGTFPKGETGVLIACEKKFGEGCVPMAKKVIGKLQSLSEMSRMKKLAGVKETTPRPAAPAKPAASAAPTGFEPAAAPADDGFGMGAPAAAPAPAAAKPGMLDRLKSLAGLGQKPAAAPAMAPVKPVDGFGSTAAAPATQFGDLPGAGTQFGDLPGAGAQFGNLPPQGGRATAATDPRVVGKQPAAPAKSAAPAAPTKPAAPAAPASKRAAWVDPRTVGF